MRIMDWEFIKELKKIEVDKISKDYMKISYAKGGNLYIPATQLDLIQKYAGSVQKNQNLTVLELRSGQRRRQRFGGQLKKLQKIW